jgi:arylsulfatase A
VKEYMPDLMHERAVRFLKASQDKPFFLYYSLVHVHGDIQPTPDSAADSNDLFGDNILYMDKLVGKLVAELDAMKLREKTLIIFMGDNGTGKGQTPLSTIGGRAHSGMKGSMLECGGLVPMIANWPGKTPAGKVSADLIDSSDFLTTFAELSGGALPKDTIFDGHSMAPQFRGEAGAPREWVFNQLAAMWYVRDAKWKLNEKNELYDMREAPFAEKLVTGDHPARAKLAAVLAKLNPAGGIPDSGDGTGRHANKDKKKPTTDLSPEEAERAEKFDKLDADKAGKISRETFISSQSDPKTAAKRFGKYDANKDGKVSRAEFIFRGQKQP